MQQEADQQRETPTESESRRVTNAATEQATCLIMSTEETSIKRSADANQQHESQANESTQQQQHCRTANANQQQESWANESPDQQQHHRTANANQEQHRRNSNGPLFQAALHCNIEHTNLMEGVELYMLGEMDVVCQFFCNANQQQESWANESPDQQQHHRIANANQEQHRRNSNGPLFQAALHSNIEHTNLMEGVKLYMLGEMDQQQHHRKANANQEQHRRNSWKVWNSTC